MQTDSQIHSSWSEDVSVTGKLASLAFQLLEIYWLQETLAQVMPILEVAISALA